MYAQAYIGHYNLSGLFEYVRLKIIRNDPERNILYNRQKRHSAMQFLYTTLPNYRFAAVKRRF